jgi:adenine nucleotide transporter 17
VSGKKLPALSAAEELAIGALSGMVARFFTMPFSCITVRKQTWENKPAQEERKTEEGSPPTVSSSVSSGQRRPSILTVAKGIYDEEGLTGFWNGFQSACLLVCGTPLAPSRTS